MATHLDEEEDLEKLKTWWRENWLALVGGLVIGFGGIGGWEAYKRWSQAKAETASQMYEDMRRALAADRQDDAVAVVDALVAEHAGSPYAAAASLLLAQHAVEEDRLDAARARLKWVAENAADEPMADLARLRYARVLLASGEHEAALAALDPVDDAYGGLREELRGDVQLARGDTEAARKSYEKALSLTDSATANRNLLRLKFEDLATGSAS